MCRSRRKFPSIPSVIVSAFLLRIRILNNDAGDWSFAFGVRRCQCWSEWCQRCASRHADVNDCSAKTALSSALTCTRTITHASQCKPQRRCQSTLSPSHLRTFAFTSHAAIRHGALFAAVNGAVPPSALSALTSANSTLAHQSPLLLH